MINQSFKKFFLLLISILIIPSRGLFPAVRTFNIEDAVKTGLSNNLEIKTAQLAAQKAQAAVDEALGNAYPSLSVSGQYTRNLKVPVFFMPNIFAGKPDEIITVAVGSDNAFQAAAQVTQILFNSAVFTGIGTSKIYSKVTQDQYRGAASKTITDIKKAFYGVLLAKEFNKAMATGFKNGSENVETVKKLFIEGMIPEFDKIRAEVALDNIKPMLLQSEAAVQNALNGLKMMLGINQTDSIDVEGGLEMPDIATEFNEEAALKNMMANNYNLQALSKVRKVNEDLISIQKSDYFPTLALFGNYVYQGQSNTFDFQTATSSAVGLNLSLSLFQGLQTNARVQQAKIDLQTTDMKYKQLEEALKLQLKSAMLQLQISKAKVDAQQRTVEQAERGYEISLIRYKEGTGSQMEINDADGALVQAKVNKSQAIYEYITSVTDFENLTGTIPAKYFELLPKVR